MSISVHSILKDELKHRQKDNPNYSLRAFSRDLKLSPGYLSDVMKNKKQISVDKAVLVSQALELSWREAQVFLQLAQLSNAKTASARRFIRQEIKKTRSFYSAFTRMKSSQFSLISDWYYFAIVELTDLKDFSDSPQWVANRLGISQSIATHALALLKKHGYIIESEDGKWIKKFNSGIKDTPSAELRKFHKQHLQNAYQAIEEQSFEQRRASGITMAINKERLVEAYELINEFRARMSALLETGEKNAVYHLAIQLFQLDNSPKKLRVKL